MGSIIYIYIILILLLFYREEFLTIYKITRFKIIDYNYNKLYILKINDLKNEYINNFIIIYIKSYKINIQINIQVIVL